MRTHWSRADEQLLATLVSDIILEDPTQEEIKSQIKEISVLTSRSENAVRKKLKREFAPLGTDRDRVRKNNKPHWQKLTEDAIANLQKTNPSLIRHGKLFSAYEDRALLSSSALLWVLAISWGRTYRSVESRRSKLLKGK